MAVFNVAWRDSAFYKEAVENTAMYNKTIMRERHERLPYIDSQTGVAQRDSHLYRSRQDRKRGLLPSQVYSYRERRWRIEAPKKTSELSSTSTEEIVAVTSNGGGTNNTSNNSTGLVQSLEGGVVTKRSSRIAGLSKKEESAVVVTTNPRVALESPMSSEINEESDQDIDFVEEYDSEEERRPRRKKKPPPRSRVTVTPQRLTRDQEKEKPHVCPVCHRRYKTSASLKAHHTQYHPGETLFPYQSSQPSVAQSERVQSSPIPPPPPPPPPRHEEKPLVTDNKKLAKRNPYCDFCLGDDAINKKTNKHERMVSCADCGRSGHPSCLQFSPELASVVVTYRWQCIECKSCSICGNSDNDDQLLFCDDCDRGYHMYCLSPPIKEPPEGSWSCRRCKQ